MSDNLRIHQFRKYNCRFTIYRDIKNLKHREDGPAWIVEYDDGAYTEAWYFENEEHRYGGPALENSIGLRQYFVHGKYVSDEVHEWLSERDYEWETMNEQEKWELELFMRNLKIS